MNDGTQKSAHAAYAYDSVLTLASALNATDGWFESDGNGSMKINLEALMEELRKSRIRGVSVSLHAN